MEGGGNVAAGLARFGLNVAYVSVIPDNAIGDAFSVGLIYGLNSLTNDKETLEFAIAASCLKHSIPGDLPLLSVKEVENLVKGAVSGRVQR